MLTRWTKRLDKQLLRGAAVCGLLASAWSWAAEPASAQPPVPPVFAPPAAAQSFTPDEDLAAAIPNAVPASATSGYGDPAVEARLRALEEQFAEREMRFASMADAKAEEKKDPSKGTVVGSDTKMNGNWKEGAYLETSDKAFKMKWRGRTQFDAVGFADSDAAFQGLTGNQQHNAVDFRRLRIGTEGTLYEQFDFAVELDFINTFNTNSSSAPFAPFAGMKNAFDRQFFGVPAPTDVWIGMHEVPLVGNIRVGNIKPANGLEHANSSRFLDFMERSLNQDAFTGRFNNGFQPGILFHGWNEEQTATYQTSITQNSYNVFAYESNGLDAATRVTWTPINDKASHGRYLMHLGFSTTYRDCVDGQERLRARGSLRNGISQSWSNVADTTIFYSTHEVMMIPEVAIVYGPWHFQAEYFAQWNADVRTQIGNATLNPGPNQGTAYFNGYYAQVSRFLTGEHREYEGKAGAFGRVVPYENFHFIRSKCGPLLTSGAWQVLYRYGVLDLYDPALNLVNNANVGSGALNGVGGGTVIDHTLGLNHFLNPNMKLQYNFVISDRSASAATPGVSTAVGGLPQTGGTSYGFGARLAIDF